MYFQLQINDLFDNFFGSFMTFVGILQEFVAIKSVHAATEMKQMFRSKLGIAW